MTAHPDPTPGRGPRTPPYGRRPGRGTPTPPYGTPEVPTTPATPGPSAGPRPRSGPRRIPDPYADRRGRGPGYGATLAARAQRPLVGIARVLAGGLVVLAVAVVAGPWLLDGPGAGGAVVVGHLVGAVVAIAATAVAAHPRTPVTLGVLAALAVPVDVLVVLGTYWWA